MGERGGQADVAEPVVKREQLDPALARPLPDRVVADRQQQPHQDLRREHAERGQADDRRDVDRGGHGANVYLNSRPASSGVRLPPASSIARASTGSRPAARSDGRRQHDLVRLDADLLEAAAVRHPHVADGHLTSRTAPAARRRSCAGTVRDVITAPAVRSPSTAPRRSICTIRANISAADAERLSTSTISRPVKPVLRRLRHLARVLPPRRFSIATTTSRSKRAADELAQRLHRAAAVAAQIEHERLVAARLPNHLVDRVGLPEDRHLPHAARRAAADRRARGRARDRAPPRARRSDRRRSVTGLFSTRDADVDASRAEPSGFITARRCCACGLM